MTAIRLRYVDCFRDRHGRARYYFRRGKGPRIPLPGLPGSDAFMFAYREALQGIQSEIKPARHPGKGTFNHLALEYFSSPDFLRLRPHTRHVYRLVIERFLSEHGHRLVREMVRDDVKRIVTSKADTPGAANDLLKKIRALIKFAIESGVRTDDPTLRIRTFPEGTIHTWTEDEIAQFEARWPKGSRERTAFALYLYTGQRRSDVVRMAWTDLAGNAIKVVQMKTGVRLTIRLHPELQEILRHWPRSHIAILTTVFGKPFSFAGFGNMMADAIKAAGLPDRCVPHGLRKAAARRLAEAGCSEKQIAAVTGHTTLKEVARYTRAANQERLAADAVDMLTEQKAAKNSQTFIDGLGNRKNS
jgi:enterobacteria phage integrase